MEPRTTVAVLGGDARQAFASAALACMGRRVLCFGVPQKAGGDPLPESAASLAAAVAAADVILCPVPFSRGGGCLTHGGAPPIPAAALLKELRPGHRLIAGDLPAEVRTRCEALKIPAHALLEREDFAMRNAIPTAEATAALAVLRGAGNIRQSECLVLGFGRCGRPLAHILKALGANVTIGLRGWRNNCAALAEGCQPVAMEALPRHMPRFRFVFNTIPALVLGEALLALLPKDAVLLDIASAPGGIDFAAAQRLGLAAELLPGLPGKYAPRAAGEAIAQVVQVILEEEEAL
ncbi:MAG: dipicolinate synthase [Oscillospiraceae bacterium]|jgi:dipicolinate synthase subunit A|nr:dipicolinate synthase [Oscillospiraceae bacterium]